jgi:hypothetical protein
MPQYKLPYSDIKKRVDAIIGEGAQVVLGNMAAQGIIPPTNTTIQGDTVPTSLSATPKYDRNISFNNTIKNTYVPKLNNIQGYSKGLKLLATAMTHQEGFYPGTKSYRTNNPGNIGNVDTGQVNPFPTLDKGIQNQLKFLKNISSGTNANYKLNTVKQLPPYQQYPGYKFTYTGKIKQFVKIYATGARSSNAYISTIVSYFHKQGYTWVTEDTTLQQLAAIN